MIKIYTCFDNKFAFSIYNCVYIHKKVFLVDIPNKLQLRSPREMKFHVQNACGIFPAREKKIQNLNAQKFGNSTQIH